MLVSISLAGNAQQLTTSEPIPTRLKASNYFIIGQVGNQYLVNNFGANIEKILAFDAASLQLKTEKTLFTKKLGNSKQLNAFGIFEDSLIVFYSNFENEKHVIEVEKMSSKLKGSVKYFDEMEMEKRNFTRVIIAKSAKQSKYLVQRHYQKGDEEVLSLKVLNEKLKVELTKKNIPYPDKSEFHSSLIDDNGVAYIIFKSINSALKKAKDYNGFIIYKFNQSASNIHFFHAQGLQLKQGAFAINQSTNNLAGAAFASKANKNEPQSLASFKGIDKDTISISVTDLKKIYQNKKKISLQHHTINQLLFRKDNGLAIISESKKVETTIKNNFANESFDEASGIQQTVYGNIFMTSLNNEGAISWYHFIPKNQVLSSRGNNYGSYSIINNGKKINFLYNESIKSNASFVNYRLNAAGDSKRKLLFNIQDQDVFPIMENARQIKSNALLFGSSRNDEFRLCKIHIEN